MSRHNRMTAQQYAPRSYHFQNKTTALGYLFFKSEVIKQIEGRKLQCEYIILTKSIFMSCRLFLCHAFYV